MNEPREEDWLDARLREEAPYIDDAGFTAAVMQQLPAPRPVRSYRGLILIGVTLLACALAYVLSGGGVFLLQLGAQLASINFLLLCEIAVACGLLLTALAAGAAVTFARHER